MQQGEKERHILEREGRCSRERERETRGDDKLENIDRARTYTLEKKSSNR